MTSFERGAFNSFNLFTILLEFSKTVKKRKQQPLLFEKQKATKRRQALRHIITDDCITTLLTYTRLPPLKKRRTNIIPIKNKGLNLCPLSKPFAGIEPATSSLPWMRSTN